MIHPVIGIGQVATATLAPDPPDRLELAQNESRQAGERRTGGEGGEIASVGWSNARGFDNSTVMNRRDGAIGKQASLQRDNLLIVRPPETINPS